MKYILKTNEPNFITVILGTNNMKSNYGLSAEDISGHLKETLELIQVVSHCLTIVICPPPVINLIDGSLDERLKDAPELSLQLDSPL